MKFRAVAPLENIPNCFPIFGKAPEDAKELVSEFMMNMEVYNSMSQEALINVVTLLVTKRAMIEIPEYMSKHNIEKANLYNSLIELTPISEMGEDYIHGCFTVYIKELLEE